MKKQLIPMLSSEVHLGFAFLFIQLLGVPVIITVACDILPRPVSAASQNFLCFALNFLCIIAIFRRYWLSSIRQIGTNALGLLSNVLLHTTLYYVTTVLLNLFIYSVEPNFSNANDMNIVDMTSGHYVLMLLGTVILVPPVEEILYRGVIFGQLYKNNRYLGYLVSVTAFSLIHVIGYIGTVPASYLLLSFLQYIPAGIFLARTFERSGNIFAPILMHALINFIGINSM